MVKESILDVGGIGCDDYCGDRRGATKTSMEINVWKNRWFALVVAFVFSLSTSLTAAPRLKNPTLLFDVHASDVTSISTSKTTPGQERNILRIQREAKTSGKMGESRFGVMAYEGKFLAYTLEHESVKIPAGTYRGELRWSERFQETVPYIHVPKRTGIEAHVGNFAADSGGCILVGTTKDGAALRNSRKAFERMIEVLPQDFTVVVE